MMSEGRDVSKKVVSNPNPESRQDSGKGNGDPKSSSVWRRLALAARVAVASLRHDRIHFFCNVAMLVGTLVPLLVLFGVKSGIYRALHEDLVSDPNLLLISTLGDNAFDDGDANRISTWPQTAFVALKTRAISDDAFVRRVDGGRITRATLVPSGPLDPLLAGDATMTEGHIVASRRLAERLSLERGDTIQVVARSETRPPLVLLFSVLDTLKSAALLGDAMLMTPGEMDLIEAYYDGYALPEHGIAIGKELSGRVTSFEGLRLYAKTLEDVAPLEARIQDEFDVRTHSRAAEIEGVLGLGRSLNLAFLLISSTAVIGLSAALMFSFWAEVDRKRRVVATLVLVGFRRRDVAMVTLVQAAIIGVTGVIAAFLLFWIAAYAADVMFAGRMPEEQSVIALSSVAAFFAVVLPLVLVLVSSLFSVKAALEIDPAIILRTG